MSRAGLFAPACPRRVKKRRKSGQPVSLKLGYNFFPVSRVGRERPVKKVVFSLIYPTCQGVVRDSPRDRGYHSDACFSLKAESALGDWNHQKS